MRPPSPRSLVLFAFCGLTAAAWGWPIPDVARAGSGVRRAEPGPPGAEHRPGAVLSPDAPVLPPDPPLPESEGYPDTDSDTPLDGASLVARGAVLVLRGDGPDRVLATMLHAPPVTSGDGRVAVITHREPDAFCSVLDLLELRDGWRVRRLVAEGCPDRAAIDRDGRKVAFVGDRTGIAAVYVVPAEGGTPTQLTNRGLQDGLPGDVPPPGFVPPPWDGPLRFDGDRLVWRGPDGPHEVQVP